MLQHIEILEANSLKCIFRLTTANLTDDELTEIEEVTSPYLINWENQEPPFNESHIIESRSFHIISKLSYIVTLVTDVENPVTEFESLVESLVATLNLTPKEESEEKKSYVNLKKTVNDALKYAQQDKDKSKSETRPLAVFKPKELIPQRSKYFLVGLGAVGKSSLYYQFFENWSIPQLENIKATISRMQRHIDDDFIQESLLINDLGGQLPFREQYLADQHYFHNAAGLIFVIDCQDRASIPDVQDYFSKILEQIESDPAPHRPLMAIFVHKFDPALRSKLEDNIFNYWFPMLQKLFRKYDPPYYLTSIYDNTARESMARFFLQSMPHYVITRVLNHEMILQATKTLYPMIQKLEPLLQENVEASLREQELYDSAVHAGREAAKKITKQWQEYLLQKELPKPPSESEDLELHVEPTGQFIVNLMCPIPKNQRVPELCAITHGLFAGLGNMFGYHHIEMNETMIRNNASKCNFSISD
ncbi:MAG: ADP-ribosylation factor-like protein [Candidatus Hodarchaeales archaeon]